MSTVLSEKTGRDETIKWWTEPSERVKRLKKQLVSSKRELSVERARYVTQSYKETENEPEIIRRAKGLEKVLKNQTPLILPDEILVGHMTEIQGSAPFFPEMSVDWLLDEIDQLSTRGNDKFFIRPEVKKEIIEEIIPYWKGHTLFDQIMAKMPEITKEAWRANVWSLAFHETAGLGHVQLYYEYGIKNGFRAIINRIKDKLEGLDLSAPDALSKYYFYNAALIVAEATIKFANRYASHAEKLASTESDTFRKNELLKIAEINRRVPEFPAENFWEAVQSFWWIQLIPLIETDGASITPGRFDQYMYPYLRDSLKTDMSRDFAQELIDSLYIKLSEYAKIYDTAGALVAGGFPAGQNIVLGGILPDGRDGTNELSYICLEAQAHIRLNQPNLSVRVHSNTPDDFLIKTVKVIATGGGMPQLANDEKFIDSLIINGIPLKEARDYCLVGCVEASVVGLWGRFNGGFFSLPRPVIFAITNGYDPILKKSIGPKTGDSTSFTSFVEFYEAFKKQMDWWVSQMAVEDSVLDYVHGSIMQAPFVSLFVPDCIDKGVDATAGGAKYNWTAPFGVGVANLGDSITAIKKLVYDEKSISMSDLREAINNNFSGWEKLRSGLMYDAPKYGNDIDYADSITSEALNVWYDSVEKHTSPRGGNFVSGVLSVTSNVGLGYTTPATPDGRLAKRPLADGVSPSHGFDVSGPTAVLKSAAKLDYVRATNGVQLNQKYNPSTLKTDGDIRNFVDMIRTYFELGGMQLQVNVVSADTLKAAQDKPDEYRDLVVRVAGYSARFVELGKDVQDDIIERTEYTELR
jgi:pyruvate formate-lyase/glycerol dehydratase family glycyl radical enzyme